MYLKQLLFLTLLLTFFASCKETSQLDETGALVPKTVTEDSTLPSILINGVALHAETFGNPTDPILIVLHGGPGADYRSILNFKDLADDSLFVVFYDQMGSGLSERLDAEVYNGVQIFIDELDSVINYYRQNDDQQIILAGHSWGAMLATAYINQYPDRIAGAILAEPGGFTFDQTMDYISRSRTLKLFGEATNDFVYQDQFLSGDDHNTLDYKMALSMASNDTGDDSSALPFWRLGSVCNSASFQAVDEDNSLLDFNENLNQYTTEVLFAYSELNEAYGKEHAELVSGAYPNVQLELIEGCGHEMPHFGWNNLYPLVKNYINEIL